jgi:hypothetical protein
MRDAGKLTEVAVRLGFGFEVSAAEVITVFREEVEPLRELDGVADGHDIVRSVHHCCHSEHIRTTR